MKNLSTFLNIHKQNKELPIRLISPSFGHLPFTTLAEYGLTHRKPYYFFLFMLGGNSTQTVDLSSSK